MLGGHSGIRQDNTTSWGLCFIVLSFKYVCYNVAVVKCASLIVDFRNDGPYLQIASNLGDKGSGLCLSLGMVLKPGPDRTI